MNGPSLSHPDRLTMDGEPIGILLHDADGGLHDASSDLSGIRDAMVRPIDAGLSELHADLVNMHGVMLDRVGADLALPRGVLRDAKETAANRVDKALAVALADAGQFGIDIPTPDSIRLSTPLAPRITPPAFTPRPPPIRPVIGPPRPPVGPGTPILPQPGPTPVNGQSGPPRGFCPPPNNPAIGYQPGECGFPGPSIVWVVCFIDPTGSNILVSFELTGTNQTPAGPLRPPGSYAKVQEFPNGWTATEFMLTHNAEQWISLVNCGPRTGPPPIGTITTTTPPPPIGNGQSCSQPLFVNICNLPVFPPCQPPPPPPPPPPLPIPVGGPPGKRPPPTEGCPFPVSVGGVGRTVTGSEGWCQDVAATAASWSGIGMQLRQFIIGTLDDVRKRLCQNPQIVPSIPTPFGDIGSFLNTAIAAIADNSICPILDRLRNAFDCLDTLFNSMTSCDPGLYEGLVFFRSFISVFNNIELGTDALALAFFRYDLDMKEILKIVDYFINYSCQAEVPGVPEAMEAFSHGLITQDQFECWLKVNGANPSVWLPVLLSRREQPVAEQWIEYARRQGVPDEQLDSWLAGRGLIVPGEREVINTLYDEIPTIQDHLHWLARNQFDLKYVIDFQLLAGFDTPERNLETLKEISADTGQQLPYDDATLLQLLQDAETAIESGGTRPNFWATFGKDLRIKGMYKKNAAYHYGAHWIQPAPGQLAEMMARNRPGRVPQDAVFTETDYFRALAEQDVAPFWRKRFRQIAFNVFGLRFLRQMWNTRTIDRAELKQRFMDLQYSEEDAERLTRSEEVRRGQDDFNKLTTGAKAKLLNAYKSGTIDRGTAAANLYLLTRQSQGERDQFLALDVGAQKDLALNDRDVLVQLDSLDAAWKQKLADQAIAAIRRQFLRGRFDLAEARNELLQAGVVDERANEILQLWQIEFDPVRRELSGEKIMSAARNRTIPIQEATGRLQKLGYPADDIPLMLAETERNMALDAAKAEAKTAASLARQQAALQRAIRAADRERRQMRTDLAKHGAPAQLVKWYARRSIEQREFYQRLAALNWPLEDINNLFSEAQDARNKMDAKRAKGK